MLYDVLLISFDPGLANNRPFVRTHSGINPKLILCEEVAEFVYCHANDEMVSRSNQLVLVISKLIFLFRENNTILFARTFEKHDAIILVQHSLFLATMKWAPHQVLNETNNSGLQAFSAL